MTPSTHIYPARNDFPCAYRLRLTLRYHHAYCILPQEVMGKTKALRYDIVARVASSCPDGSCVVEFSGRNSRLDRHAHLRAKRRLKTVLHASYNYHTFT